MQVTEREVLIGAFENYLNRCLDISLSVHSPTQTAKNRSVKGQGGTSVANAFLVTWQTKKKCFSAKKE